jgi:hypothetical protein
MKMDKSLSHLCRHGCGEAGTLIHLLWNGPSIKRFWKDVICNLSYILKVKIALCPLICLFGRRAANIEATLMQHIIALAFMSVKRIIMMNWKVQKPNCSNTDNWLKHFMDLLSMERATSFLNDLDRGDEGLWILINYLIKTL